LKVVYGLPYRQTIGFAQSIFNLLHAEVEMPDYTLLCKRSTTLAVDLAPSETDEPKHIVVDSTGLKIYGEGEWKVRQHGYSKRRTWRKFHLSGDEKTQELQAVVVTEASVDDAEAGKKLLEETPGEIVKAVVPKGKATGTHIGRVAVRARKPFRLNGCDINSDYMRPLHCADRYSYAFESKAKAL
jgi:IS5 family transposase